jgi:hypothetical protein
MVKFYTTESLKTKKRKIRISARAMGKYKVEGFEKLLSRFLSLFLLLISLVTSVPTFQHHFQSTYTLLHLLTGLFHCQG